MKSVQLDSYQEPLKMVIYGKQGTGKSRFASEFAKLKNNDGEMMQVLYVDVEKASLGRGAVNNLKKAGVNLNDFRLFPVNEMKDLEAIVNKIRNREEFYEVDEDGNELEVIKNSHGKAWFPDVIVIDSLSALNQDEQIFFNDISKIRTKIKSKKAEGKTRDEKLVDEATAGLELKDRGNIKTNGTKIITNIIRKLDIHCVLIFREKNETQTKKTGAGIEIIDTGNKILDSWQFAVYEGNIVVRLDNDIDGTLNQYKAVVEKDRTETFIAGEEVENPTPLMWQDIIYDGADKASPYQEALTSDEIIDKKIKKEEEQEIDVNTGIMAFLETFKILDNKKKSAIMKELSANGISNENISEKTLPKEKLPTLMEILEKNK